MFAMFFLFILALCSAQLTVVFIVDGSHKMGDANFAAVRNFITNASSHFDVAINKTWIITSVEGNETNVYRTAAELNNSITLHFPNTSQVLLGKSLETVKDRLSQNDLQRHAAALVVLIASQKSDDDIAIPAINLKKINATIFALGIGNDISLGQMKEMASNPDNQHFVQCNDANELLAKGLSVARKICQGKHIKFSWMLFKSGCL